jgi:hypothetical protein
VTIFKKRRRASSFLYLARKYSPKGLELFVCLTLTQAAEPNARIGDDSDVASWREENAAQERLKEEYRRIREEDKRQRQCDCT